MSTRTEFEMVNALRAMDFFHDMDTIHLRKLASIAMESKFAAGDIIYKEGDLDKAMYLIQEGEVVIEMKTLDQSTYATVLTVGPRELFGWSSLFPNQRKRARARAKKDTRAFILDGDRLNHMFQSDHKLENMVMRRIIQLVAERVNATRKQKVEPQYL